MNLYEMSCPALPQSQVACNHTVNYFTSTVGHPKPPQLAMFVISTSLLCFCHFIRYAGGKICSDLIRGVPSENTIKWFPSSVPPPPLLC